MAGLRKGQKLNTIKGCSVTVEALLGEGGQGYVYRVNYNGRPKALKWYKAEDMLDSLAWFNQNLRNNISKGSPSPIFLWPEDMTETYNGSFGYIMQLRPKEYHDFPDFLLAKVEFKKFSAMIDAALNIVTGFRILHREGYTYQDLNDGNFFIDPVTGNVLICDNDNVSESGENSGIAGKARYMAPLVVLGKKMPDKITDRFSMAVVLFMLFVRNHPLEGKAVYKKVILTEGYQKSFFGENPVFIADPTDDSNRPVSGEEHNRNFRIRWPLLSEEVRELFIKAFSKEAMFEQKGFSAPIDIVWCRTLLQYRSDLVACPYCNCQVVYNTKTHTCMKCRRDIAAPGYLKTGHYEIPLFKGSTLLAEHINDFESENYDNTVIGEIIVAKNDSSAIGLRNLSDNQWQYEKNGSYTYAKKNDVIHLSKGRKIRIGDKFIEVI